MKKIRLLYINVVSQASKSINPIKRRIYRAKIKYCVTEILKICDAAPPNSSSSTNPLIWKRYRSKVKESAIKRESITTARIRAVTLMMLEGIFVKEGSANIINGSNAISKKWLT
jgi:hypothetical protein